MKKFSKRFLAIFLILCIFCSCTNISELPFLSSETTSSKSYSVLNDPTVAKNDFYQYVNQNWIDSTPAPSYSPVVSAFSETTSTNLGKVYQSLENNLARSIDKENTNIGKLTRFYSVAKDQESREAQGIDPVVPYLQKIEDAENLEELQAVAAELDLAGIGNFVQFHISPDAKDSTINRLYLNGPLLGLSDQSYYSPDQNPQEAETYRDYIAAYKECLSALIMQTGKNAKDAQRITDEAFGIEAQLASSILSQEDSSNSEKVYNKYGYDKFTNSMKNFNLDSFLDDLNLSNANYLIVEEVDYYKKLDSLYVDENLEAFRSYLYAQTLFQTAPLLSPTTSKIRQDYENAIYGTSGYMDAPNEALYLSRNYMNEQIGELYVTYYFSEEVKQSVTEMVEQILKTYEKRITELDWMGNSTKNAAIKKLQNMDIKVGYPDEWSDLTNLVISSPSEGGSLFQNVVNLYQYDYDEVYSQIDQPVNRSEWAMSAFESNAYYKNSSNEIVIPAGILQEPFYSVNYSESQNFGAIGTIIAHEISHAFDSEGRKYDENGSINNWWTQTDLNNYEKRTAALIDQFNAYEAYPDYFVNGNLTLNENIADLGAVSCITEVVGDLANGNYEEMFEAYATIYREKITEVYGKRLLLEDNHAPSICRVNIILSNIDTFYDVYGVTQGDGMYRPAENRIQIW